MTPTILCILLFAIGIVLIIGELFLPTHGTLGIIGGGAILGAIGIGFHMNQWIGVVDAGGHIDRRAIRGDTVASEQSAGE